MQLSSSPFSKHHLNKYVSPKLLSTNDFAFVMYKQKLMNLKLVIEGNSWGMSYICEHMYCLGTL
jgi:hypothetical protein